MQHGDRRVHALLRLGVTAHRENDIAQRIVAVFVLLSGSKRRREDSK
jgi:hypothetical protein